MSVPNINALVKACCVLHNFTGVVESVGASASQDRGNGDTNDPEGGLPSLLDVTGAARGRLNRAASGVRETFADYFCSDEGAVPWQEESLAQGKVPIRNSFLQTFVKIPLCKLYV